MYGCVLSGALAGHVHGTAAYDITTSSEQSGTRSYFWQALRFKSAGYMKVLRDFVLSEGARYRDLQLASSQVEPRRPGNRRHGLGGENGWPKSRRVKGARLGIHRI